MAFSAVEWMIAGRYLRARRKEGAISVIAGFSLVGIMLGVATLIIVMAVMNGFRTELVGRILGAQSHITVLSAGGVGIETYDETVERIVRIPTVTRAAPMIEGQVMASTNSGNSGVMIRGLRKKDIMTLSGVAAPENAAGSLDDYDQGVAIGNGVAQQLNLLVGDKITLINPRGIQTVLGTKPTIKTYTVTYIFRIGNSAYDKVIVFMPLEEAQKFFRKPDRVDGIEVMLANPDEVERVSVEIQPQLPEGTFLWNWKRANSAFISALDVERNVMFLILSLIILVAALNIISGLIMLVKEKGQNIGIMRTFGMSRGAVMRIFFICGASIGVVGTALGVLLGVLFVTYIHDIQALIETISGSSVWDPELRFLTRIPAIMHLSDVLITIAIALTLSFFATWYPARRAAALDPVEALRYE